MLALAALLLPVFAIQGVSAVGTAFGYATGSLCRYFLSARI